MDNTKLSLHNALRKAVSSSSLDAVIQRLDVIPTDDKVEVVNMTPSGDNSLLYMYIFFYQY